MRVEIEETVRDSAEYLAGYKAGLRGDRLSNCNYLQQPRVEKWEAGWHEGRIQAAKEKQDATRNH